MNNTKMRMTPTRIKVLEVLSKREIEVNRRQLFDALHEHKDNAPAILKSMEGLGFITIRYEIPDRQSKIFSASITDYGKKIYANLRQHSSQSISKKIPNPCGMTMKICYHAGKCHLSYKCSAAQHT